MYLRHIITLSLSLCVLGLSACASAPSNTITLPATSAAVDRPALTRTMGNIVSQYIAQKYSCDDWSLINVLESTAHGQLVFTQDGQLYQGSFTEQWALVQCNAPLTLQLNVKPNPNGGNTIKIRRLN